MITLLKLTPYPGDQVAPSPNHDERSAAAIQGIVLHATVDNGDESRALNWMRSPKSRVSCHLHVGRSGDVTRLVGDRQRAWHAGLSWWRGTPDVNSITIGIEIANRNDGEPYTDAQYQRVAAIVGHYCRQGLALDDVVSHAEIAPGRRADPLGWDWERFRALVRDQLWDEWPVPFAPRESGEVAVAGAGKSALCSRTIWLNGLTVLAAGAVIIGETLDLAFSVGLSVPEEITMWALFAMGVVNILLRYSTTCPIGSRQRV